MHLARRLGTVILIATVIAVVVAFGMRMQKNASLGGSAQVLAAKPDSYLGVYVPGMPTSDAGLAAFGSRTGTRPNVGLYYSGWLEPFQVTFATELAARGAVPLVQIDPAGYRPGRHHPRPVQQIPGVLRAGGPRFRPPGDHQLRPRDERRLVFVGQRQDLPRDFVAAWQHIVKVFRSWGAYNVTWLWTINSLAGGPGQAAGRQAWWPGASYVNWVGIDGYYYYPAESFTTLFGTTDLERSAVSPAIRS